MKGELAPGSGFGYLVHSTTRGCVPPWSHVPSWPEPVGTGEARHLWFVRPRGWVVIAMKNRCGCAAVAALLVCAGAASASPVFVFSGFDPEAEPPGSFSNRP